MNAVTENQGLGNDQDVNNYRDFGNFDHEFFGVVFGHSNKIVCGHCGTISNLNTVSIIPNIGEGDSMFCLSCDTRVYRFAVFGDKHKEIKNEVVKP